jgi:hypothetical protein
MIMSIQPWYDQGMLIVPIIDEDEDLQLSKSNSLTNLDGYVGSLACKWIWWVSTKNKIHKSSSNL